MKIAFVVHDYAQTAGQSRYVVELAERFSTSHEVHVYSNTFCRRAGSNVRFHYIPAWRRTAQGTILSFLVSAGLRVKKGFDIIHGQGLSSVRADVITAHICTEAWLRAQERYRVGQPWKRKVFERLVCPLERRLYRASKDSWVIAVSEKTRGELAKLYGRWKRVKVIYHGVDLERFTASDRNFLRATVRRNLGLTEKDTVFLYVGDLHKGAAFAMSALELLPEGKLVFVSGTSPTLYLRKSQQLGIRGRVIFCPPTTDIRRFYAAADVFVFPTVYDAFGMVVSEAMAAGLPIIASSQAGVTELVSHGGDGFVLDDAADVSQMAEYLRELAEDPMLRQRLGRRAQEKMRTHSWDRVADQTMRVYEEAAAARRLSE
jgi:UDP-glucose:(heptosyl)LPS alpha-1,3-glucosyltransferase